MSLTDDFAILDRALQYVMRDRTCLASTRFSPACGRCFGTGATDVGRKTHLYDGGCEACGGTGRINDMDGLAALRRLRGVLT